MSNFAELETVVQNNRFEFIILSETCVTPEIEDNELFLKNYNINRCDSESRHTGGVIIFVNERWQTETLQVLSINKDIWWLSLRVFCETYSFMLVALYRSPSCSKSVFCEKFIEWVDELNERSDEILIVGDFNIDWFQSNDVYKKNIERYVKRNGLKQLVNSPTRITKSSKTLIDFVITNSKKITVKTAPDFKITDHESVLININIKIKKKLKRKS